MISSDGVEIVYSELLNRQVFSEEDPDYRVLTLIRITEENEPRITENDLTRLIE